jgi:uncharacterized membrane protein
MEDVRTTRHPLEWSFERFLASLRPEAAVAPPRPYVPPASLVPRHLKLEDLRGALTGGLHDFQECRTDVVFLCIMYPIIGLLLGRLTFGTGLVHLAFPLVSGFALVGPLFAAGLYEMSRQRELGGPVGWQTAFDAFRSPAIGSIIILGLVLLGLFVAWMGAADLIYWLTLGASLAAPGAGELMGGVLGTHAGAMLLLLGVGVGAVFAAVVLAISVVSFPLLLDRNVGVAAAVALSVRAVRENPRMLCLWGLIVAGGLALGSVPFLLGLAIVLPVLGHATWHLYRRIYP